MCLVLLSPKIKSEGLESDEGGLLGTGENEDGTGEDRDGT